MMTKSTGVLQKMPVENTRPVTYRLPLGDQVLVVNEYLGQDIELIFNGRILCLACGRQTRKSFQQGYCYPCFRKLARCDLCIVRPELCHYADGTCREPDWGQQHCMTGHIVYLANSSGIKVGITRATQLPTRWIDQGADSALAVFSVPSRLVSGQLEAMLKAYVSDRTDWRKMLKGAPPAVALFKIRDQLLEKISVSLQEINKQQQIILLGDADIISVVYPVLHYPEKIRALNFDKTATISGRLQGIKGQYLLLDSGVLNIRKFGGYEITFHS